jgi:sialidase-1
VASREACDVTSGLLIELPYDSGMARSEAGAVIFSGGRGYRAVRIPAIVALDEQRIVVVAVGRRRVSDWGSSDLLIRRSNDGGLTWTHQRILVRGWWRTVDNPTLVVDATVRIHLLYQVGYRRLWHRISTDGGVTFAPPVELSQVVRAASTEGFVIRQLAPGPGSGALLTSGRLVVPVWAASGRRHRPSATLTIVSDDDGSHWQPGEIVAGPRGRFPNPTEAAIAPVAGGGAVLSFRQRAVRSRVFSWSPDGATHWSTPVPIDELFEPVCHAALAAFEGPAHRGLAFVNPDSRASSSPLFADGKAARENLTLRVSSDEGHSWGRSTVIDAGPSGYSALAADQSGGLHIVWEHGRLARTAVWPTSINYRRVDFTDLGLS